MEDDKIIALYWARKEEAISETDRKYGSYCRSISFRILNDKEGSDQSFSGNTGRRKPENICPAVFLGRAG